MGLGVRLKILNLLSRHGEDLCDWGSTWEFEKDKEGF